MTQISPFGIGAGRMVSAASEDDDSRTRQRRLSAAQLAEQSRKSAAMREQLMHAERAAALSESRQRQQDQERAATARRERQPGMPVKQAAAQPTAEAKVASARSQRPAAVAGTEPDRPVDDLLLRRGPDGDPMPADDSRMQHQPGSPPDALISRLVDALPVWRAQGSTAALEEQLDQLRLSVSALRHSPDPDSPEGLKTLAASLDFVEGYLEAGSLPDDARRRLLLMIDGVRQDAMALLSALASPAAGAMPAVAATLLPGAGATRAHGPGAGNRSERSGAAARGRAAGVAGDDEDAADAEASAAAGATPTVPPAWIEPARAADPSQQRDTEKRKNETPVSVAVRSV